MNLRLFKQFLMEGAGDGNGGGGGSFLNQGGDGGGGSGTPPDNSGGAGTTPPAQGGAGDFKWPENWKDYLPDDLKGENSLKMINDVPTLVKSYVNAQRLVGADKIPLPGKHATEADWAAVYQRLGLPQDIKDYKMDLGKEPKFQEQFLKDFTAQAHKVGILPKQAEALLKWYEGFEGNTTAAQLKEQETNQKAEWDGLKKEWGQAFDQKGRFAQQLVKEHASPEMKKFLDESGLGNNTQVVRFLAQLGEMVYKEDGLNSGGSSGKHTPQDALKAANAIMADFSHPYHVKDHPNHQAAVQEVQELFEQAYPKQKDS